MVTRVLFILLTCFVLTACEAPLVLDGVEQAKKEPIHRTDRIQAIASIDNDVLVVGVGFILNSTDSGKTWVRTSPEGLPALIGAVICPNKTQVAISAEKQAWVSVDSGKTWTENDLQTEEAPQYISCSPDNKLWVTGSFSTFLNSSDNGKTWQQSSLDEDLIFTFIQFFDEQNGIAIGEFGSVYNTVDGGESWVINEEMIPNEFYPLAVSFADRDHGWIGGSSGLIFRTEDAGKTWIKEETGSEAPIYGLLAKGEDVYAVGGFGTFLERKQLEDGTAKWVTSNAVSTRFYLRAIAPLGDKKIILGGGAGTLRLLVDDGSGRLVAANTEQGE